ncbi:hypothetical protein Vafri_2024 [Volvox africanus]|nr:hypothetical protein Vafri_2024 [Volvox africanus]
MKDFSRRASRLRAHAFTQLAVAGLLSALVGFTLQLTKLSALDSSGRQYDQGTYTGKLGFLAVFGISKAAGNLIVGWLVTRLGYVRTELAGWLLGLLMPLLLLLAGHNNDGDSAAAAGWRAVIGANVVLGLQQGLCWSVTVLAMIMIMPATRRGLASGLNETLGYAAVASAAPIYGVLESVMVRCGWAVPMAALSEACRRAAMVAAPPSQPLRGSGLGVGGDEVPTSPPSLPQLDPQMCTSPDTWEPACLGECQCQGYDRLLEMALLVLLPTGLAVTGLLMVEPSPAALAARSSTMLVRLPIGATAVEVEDAGTGPVDQDEGHRGEDELGEAYELQPRWRRVDSSSAGSATKPSAHSSLAEVLASVGVRGWLKRIKHTMAQYLTKGLRYDVSYMQLCPEQQAETRRLLPRPATSPGVVSILDRRETTNSNFGTYQPGNNQAQNFLEEAVVRFVQNGQDTQPDSGPAHQLRLQRSTQIHEIPQLAALADGYAALPGPCSEPSSGFRDAAPTATSADEDDLLGVPSSPLTPSLKSAAPFEVNVGGGRAAATDGMQSAMDVGTADVERLNVQHGPGTGPSGNDFLDSMRRFCRAFVYYTWSNPSTASMCLAGATSNALTSLEWGLLLTWARDGLGVPGPGRNLLTTSYSFLKGLVQLLAGAVSDTAGRKAPIMLGLLLNTAGLLTSACGAGWGGRLLVAAVTPQQRLLVQFGYLLLGSCLMGSGAGVFYPVMPAAVVDHHKPQQHDGEVAARQGRVAPLLEEPGEHSVAAAMATYRFWRDLGYTVGALGGPVADWFGVEVTLLVAAAACLLVAGLVGLRYEEKTPVGLRIPVLSQREIKDGKVAAR